MPPSHRPRAPWGLAILGIAGLLVCLLVPRWLDAQQVPRLTFAQLAESIRANAALSPSITAYGGTEVEIQGFIIPAGPPDLSFFLLSRVSATGNYCCELPSGQDEVVYVYAARGMAILYDPLRVYRVRGVFEAGRAVDAARGVSLFRVRNARVDEAPGARIFKVEPAPGARR